MDIVLVLFLEQKLTPYLEFKFMRVLLLLLLLLAQRDYGVLCPRTAEGIPSISI